MINPTTEERDPETLPEFTSLAEKIERGEDPYVVPEVLLIEPVDAVAAPAAPAAPEAETEADHERERPVAATAEDLVPAPPQINQSMWHLVQRMKVGERLKLALRGNREARAILLRDSNKMIQRFVLKNPRITDDEIIQLARNRNADSELLRDIADHKHFARNLQVRQALVTNPKSPIVAALRFLPSISERELRQIAKSRNVSAAVVSAARRLLLQRTKSNN